jgi:hypothetical protein
MPTERVPQSAALPRQQNLKIAVFPPHSQAHADSNETWYLQQHHHSIRQSQDPHCQSHELYDLLRHLVSILIEKSMDCY